jgi:nitronate monooxygenase
MAWHLTKLNNGLPDVKALASTRLPDLPVLPFLDACLGWRPKAAWLAFGAEEEMIIWSKVIQKRDSELQEQKPVSEDDPLVYFVMIGTPKELQLAVEKTRADVIVVQGTEAGGHGRADAPPLDEFLPTVIRELPQLKPSNAAGRLPLVLGAGGLANGSDLASIIRKGAHGGVYGTRFLLTPESLYSDAQKELLCRTQASDTIKSFAFDEARGPNYWPVGVDGRGINNLTVRDYNLAKSHGNLDDTVKQRQDVYAEAVKSKDLDRVITWSGTGVSRMAAVLSASKIVDEITAELDEATRG